MTAVTEMLSRVWDPKGEESCASVPRTRGVKGEGGVEMEMAPAVMTG